MINIKKTYFFDELHQNSKISFGPGGDQPVNFQHDAIAIAKNIFKRKH